MLPLVDVEAAGKPPTPLPFMPVHHAPSPYMTVCRSTRRMAVPGAGVENGDELYAEAPAVYC